MQPTSRSRAAFVRGTSVGAVAVVAAALVVLLACGDSSTTRVAGPSTLSGNWALAKLASGDDLTTDTVFAKLAPLRVVVRFNDGPMSGVAVRWTVDGAIGAVASTTTDSDGVASLDFAFGSKAGLYVVQGNLPGRPEVAAVVFSGTALPGRPTALRVVSGTGQIDTATAQLRDSLVVRAIDSYENGTPGVAVDWVVTGGDGSVSQSETTTLSPDGTSAVRYALGRAVGTNTVTASLHDMDAKVTFQAGASAANPAKLTMVSGNDQTAVVNHALGADYVVKVTDNYDNVAAGVVIGWKITGGGGSLSASTVTSGPDGIGSTRSTLGPANVAQAVNAALSAWPKVPAVTFSSLGTAPPAQPPPPPPPPPPALSTLTLVSGDGQVADPGSSLPAPIVVMASDSSGHALPNRAITFAVASGGGSVSPAVVATDANGLAQTMWRLGPSAGTQTLNVSAPAVTNTVLTVSATAGKPPLLFVGVDPSYFYYYGSALPQSLGIGQYKNIWVGPSTFSPVPAPLTIGLSHNGAAHTSVPSTVTIPTGETFSQFTVTGTSTGADAIVASAAGYTQATFTIGVDFGTIAFGVVDLPPALAVGVSKDVTICANAPDGDWVFLSAPITLSLTASTNVKFVTADAPGTTVTSVTIPANDNCAYLLVQGVAAGSASVTLSSPNYKTLVTTVTVAP